MRWWNEPLVPFVRSRPGGWLYVNVIHHIDRPLLKLSRGRVGSIFGEQLLLLTTTGAKTGRTRTTPLLYIPDGDEFVLIASRGGNTSHPAWYHNLIANPHATVLLGGQTIECVAHQADGDERARLWIMANAYYSGYDIYQSRTKGRTVPVMVLTPDLPDAA